MSLRALTYADYVLDHDETLGTPSRLALHLLADSCNRITGQAFTGDWLAKRMGITNANMLRALKPLRDRGYVLAEERPGKALLIRFPMAAYISTTPRENGMGQESGDSATPRVSAREPRAKTSGIPRSIPLTHNSSPTTAVARELLCCDGTAWVYNEETDDVSPCPLHHPRGKAVGS
jgi:hypothetical protein